MESSFERSMILPSFRCYCLVGDRDKWPMDPTWGKRDHMRIFRPSFPIKKMLLILISLSLSSSLSLLRFPLPGARREPNSIKSSRKRLSLSCDARTGEGNRHRNQRGLIVGRRRRRRSKIIVSLEESLFPFQRRKLWLEYLLSDK